MTSRGLFGFVFIVLTAMNSVPRQVEARQINTTGTFSGSYVNTQIDTNGDGAFAGFAHTQGKGSLGNSTFQGMIETEFSAEGVCRNGAAGFVFELVPDGPRDFVQRFESTGDLVFLKQTRNTLCFDPVTELVFFNGEWDVTGGTGRFEGATGNGGFEGVLKDLFADNDGNYFGQQSGTFTNTIEVLKGSTNCGQALLGLPCP